MIQKAFFLPNKSCPRRCVYCDQHAITGKDDSLTPEFVRKEVNKYHGSENVEICFFGGSFTCLPIEQQRSLLDAAMATGVDNCIRLSTHPLCFDQKIFELLSNYPVSMIELGVSSLDNLVLERCRRGYSDRDVLEVIRTIDRKGFNLGIQLMIGLPHQYPQSSFEDIDKLFSIIKGNHFTLRIYPCLVLKNTDLEKMYRRGEYYPLSLEQAVEWAGRLHNYSAKNGISIQRVGLHETDSLDASVIAGPHHPSLGELARGFSLAMDLHEQAEEGPWSVPAKKISMIKGHKRHGMKVLSRLSGLSLPETEERLTFE